MIEALAAWRPSTWVDYLLLYMVPGASMIAYLLVKILLDTPSDFAKSLVPIMGKEETWLDKIKEAVAFSFGVTCVLVGWPGFLVWLVKDKLDEAARQKRYDEPDFNWKKEIAGKHGRNKGTSMSSLERKGTAAMLLNLLD